MPPKPKFTKEEIVEAAYAVARENGMDAVAARTVGKQLGATSTPIFTYFTGMDELKQQVYHKAKEACIAYLSESVHYFPTFKEFGMRWMRFAHEEPNLYRLLFTADNLFSVSPDRFLEEFAQITEPILRGVMGAFGLSLEEAKNLFQQMVIHANGIATFSAAGEARFDEETNGRLLSEVCIGLVTTMKLKNGTFDPEQARVMAMATGKMPERR